MIGWGELLREAEYRNPGHGLYGHAAEYVDELCDALDELCTSVERENELNQSISGTLMGDVRIARATLAKARGDA